MRNSQKLAYHRNIGPYLERRVCRGFRIGTWVTIVPEPLQSVVIGSGERLAGGYVSTAQCMVDRHTLRLDMRGGEDAERDA